MQVWLNHILTFNIPLTQTWIILLSEVNILTFFILIQQLISNQNNIKSLSEVNILTFFILIQQLISNQNNIKWLIKLFN